MKIHTESTPAIYNKEQLGELLLQAVLTGQAKGGDWRKRVRTDLAEIAQSYAYSIIGDAIWPNDTKYRGYADHRAALNAHIFDQRARIQR